MPEPLFRKVDAIEIAVPDLEQGLAYYRDRLGHGLVWRTDTAAGLRMRDTDTEILLQVERPDGAVDVLVESADEAADAVVRAGGRLVADPLDIPIGRGAVVEDPWGNLLVLLDTTKGTYKTDPDGRILGVMPPNAPPPVTPAGSSWPGSAPRVSVSPRRLVPRAAARHRIGFASCPRSPAAGPCRKPPPGSGRRAVIAPVSARPRGRRRRP